MLALAVLVAVVVLMWLGQTVALARAGLPPRWRIGARDLPEQVKRASRVVSYGAIAAALTVYPLLRGQTPPGYYLAFFPPGHRLHELLYGLAAGTLYLALLYLAWLATDNVRFGVRHPARKLARRLAGAPLTAVLVATVEELLFRAALLGNLLECFPPHVAVPIGVLVFAAAHYVRDVKRYWTVFGHLALGGLLCLAFWLTGALWLPLGLHAGGIWVLMTMRPLVHHVGPAWLVGASVFPYAGLVGLASLVLLTLNIWVCYGSMQWQVNWSDLW